MKSKSSRASAGARDSAACSRGLNGERADDDAVETDTFVVVDVAARERSLGVGFGAERVACGGAFRSRVVVVAVSYTHLTLPTIYSV